MTTRRSTGIHAIVPDKLYQSVSWTKRSDEQVEELLRAYKLTGIVNLWHDDKRLAAAPWYEWLPMPDGRWPTSSTSSPAIAEVNAVVRQIAAEIRRGGRVLVMCRAGRNRSGLLTALVVRQLTGCSGPEAVAGVRRGRPRALANPHFERYLERLAALA
jgi:protein-tyrosine phosphatase